MILRCKCGRLTTYGITCIACTPSLLPEEDYSFEEEEEEEPQNFSTYDITNPEGELED